MRRVLTQTTAAVWLLSGRAVAFMGAWIYFVALAAYVYDRTGSAFWVAGITITRFLPILLLGSWGGLLAARREQVRLLVQSYLLMALVTIALLAAVIVDGSLWLILGLHLLASSSLASSEHRRSGRCCRGSRRTRTSVLPTRWPSLPSTRRSRSPPSSVQAW